MSKKWDTAKRYSTAADWVRASLESAGVSAQTFGSEQSLTRYCDLLGSTCKRSKGIWTRLKRPPRDDRGLVWHAFKVGNHYARWGYLGAWSESLTFQLMDASHKARDDFEFVLDYTIAISKMRREA